MSWETKIGESTKKVGEYAGKFLANGGHAQQDIPAQHRLLNAGVMFLGWWAGDKLRDVLFGTNQISEGEFVDIKREDVPAPLRFLHKAIDWDPYSEAPSEQWKKLAHQLLPAVGAGVGAVAGSMMAFERNGRANTFATHKKAGSLALMDAEMAAQYAQSTPLRVLAAAFGTFSAASGLTFLYGLFLNTAFASANGARVFTGSLAKGNMGPAKALDAQLGSIGVYVKEAAAHGGAMDDKWAKAFVEKVLEPLFGHELQTPEAQERAVKTLQGMVERAYQKAAASGHDPKAIAKQVSDELAGLLSKNHIDQTLLTEFHLDPKKAVLGNATPIIRWPVEALEKVSSMLGIKSKTSMHSFQERLNHTFQQQPLGVN